MRTGPSPWMAAPRNVPRSRPSRGALLTTYRAKKARGSSRGGCPRASIPSRVLRELRVELTGAARDGEEPPLVGDVGGGVVGWSKLRHAARERTAVRGRACRHVRLDPRLRPRPVPTAVED